MPQHISKLLVANRGEIALRVVRTAREMGIPTVVVYAEQDRHCQYVQMADEAYLLSGDTYADTYLNEDLLISILERSGADAVHPGYGFLSEVASFATRVMDAGAVWVGPSPRALKALGDKISARNVATKAKVPPVPGISHAVSDMRVLLDFAHTHGYPLMMKRTDGGGGRGITLVRNDDELRGFYLNHNAVQYVGLGTCEFMVTDTGKAYFLEVNPRLQVEHTVSEEVCGLDLVREQLTIAAGGHLTPAPAPRGHSFELRITSEDPKSNLTPSSGTLETVRWPSGPGIRVDSGVAEGDTISPKFDSMMGKLIVTAHDRPAAVARVRRALAELDIAGVPTPVELYAQIFADGDFTCEHGTPFDVSTKWLERKYLNREPAAARAGQPASVAGAAAAEDTARTASERFVIEVNNRRVELTVPLDVVANLTGGTHARAAQLPTQPLRGQGMHHVERKEAHDERPGVISAPMQAIVTRITVAPGQAVAKGDLLVVLESMKMENYVYAPAGGTVTEIFAAPATGVEAGETLLTMDVAGARHGGDAHHAPAAESAQSEEAHA